MSRRQPTVVARLLLTAALGLSSPVLAADSEGPVGSKEAYEHLTQLNTELRTAWELLPKRYGADPVKEATAIGEAQKTVNTIVRQIQGKHKSADEAFKALQANIAQFNEQLDVARLAQKASAANAIIRDKHAAEQPATADELGLLDQAVAILAEKGGDGWAPVTGWFEEQKKVHRARAEELKQLAAQRAADAQAADRQAKLEAAMKAANGAMNYVATALGDEGSVSPAIFRELQIAANKVAAIDAGAARFYMQRLMLLKLASALKEPKKAQQAEMTAAALEGGLVTSGRVRSKTLKARFSVDANWCYALAMRHDGGESVSVSPVEFSKKSQGALQTFSIPQPVPGWQRVVGVCTEAKGRVTARADVDLEGGSVRWAVVGWPRADVPKALFAQAEVLMTDRCDYEGFVSMWKSPVPGTVVYFQGRPHLVRSIGPVGTDKVTLVDVAGKSVEASKGALRSAPEGAKGPLPTWEFAGCPAKESATASRSKKINKCVAKVERKHKRAIAKAEKLVARAKTDAKREKAQAKLDAELADTEAEREKRCGPLEAKAAEEGRAAFRDVVELVESAPISTSIDRAAVLAGVEKARPEL